MTEEQQRDQVLVMIKPDGLARRCTAHEVQTVHEVWTDLVAWLGGADPDELRHAGPVAKIAQKAALRMVRFPEYDISTWASQAPTDVPRPRRHLHGGGTVALSDVASDLLRSLGLIDGTRYGGWLNRVTIELLYGSTESFRTHRDILVPWLLNGPVIIQQWRGPRRELAHAVKFVIRSTLSTSALSNLIHVELTTDVRHDAIGSSLISEMA